MDQVFDLREFIVKLFMKFKLALILGVILAILGSVYGYFGFMKNDLYMTTSTANISLKVMSNTDATALTSVTTAIEQVVKTDYFYTAMVREVSSRLTPDENIELFGRQNPTKKVFSSVVQLYTRGNMVFVDIIAENEALSKRVSRMCIDYASIRIQAINNSVTVNYLSQQSVNMNELEGTSVLKESVKFGILGFVGGIVLAVLLIFFVDVMDLRIKSKDDFRKYNLPVLGEIRKGEQS